MERLAKQQALVGVRDLKCPIDQFGFVLLHDKDD